MELENYNKVLNYCNNNNLKLLTSFEDFERKRLTEAYLLSHHYVRVDFVGICGHNSSAVVTNLINRNTGARCKECVKKRTADTHKTNNANLRGLEYDSIQIVEEYLSEFYEIVRTKEGCKADLAIRKKGEVDDKYIAIQMKSNIKKVHKMYAFGGFRHNYDNMLILGVCISEKKIWVIPYSDLKIKSKLNISERSKYNKYLLSNNNDLYKEIEKHNDKYSMFTLKQLMTPISALQQREQEYVQKREKYVDFLQYDYPSIQNTPTDFIVNGKKVQEKVAGINRKGKKEYLCSQLSSNNGKSERNTRKFRTYRRGENDYYWFHSSIDDRFWVIPEKVLFENGYLSKEDETKNRQTICLNIESEKYEWLKYYQYNYNKINRDNIIKLFE